MTKVINLRKRRKVTSKKIQKPRLNNIKISSDLYYLIYTAISVGAILAGCLIFKFKIFNYYNIICNETIKVFCSSDFLQIFIIFLKKELAYFILVFFIGTSLIGMPVCVIPVIIKSITIGYFSSYIYCEYELKGILFCLILIYPVSIITTASMIYASGESLYMSKYIYSTVIKKNTVDNMSVRLYLMRYMFLLFINIVCIAVNSLLINTLVNRFNLL